MIPKVIHYCWFGGNALDELAIKCITSWKRFFPDYEIIQWNEKNFDISQNSFMEKAYKNKKWAFVSDVARLMIVYENGGIYFDTDVEVIAPYTDILQINMDGFLAFEKTNYVNTGLGFGAIKHHSFLKELIKVYEKLDYDQYSERLSEIACPIITTKLMETRGFIVEDRRQNSCGFEVYPTEYFSPIDFSTGKTSISDLTHSIHWYNDSWNTYEAKRTRLLEQRLRRLCGKRIGALFFGIYCCVKQEGLVDYVKTRIKKRFR